MDTWRALETPRAADPPGAQLTNPLSINSGGAIVGYYQDAGVKTHGFLRGHDGTLTSDGVPAGNSTYARVIDDKGLIAGNYADANGIRHGFERTTKGVYKTFDPKNSTYTYVSGLASDSTIAGYCTIGSTAHGYVRAKNKITTFDPQGSTYTAVSGIDDDGDIAGWYNRKVVLTGGWLDTVGVQHGFVESK
jgi:hypothetical protein